MKYLAALIIPFFIMSCALEKESADYINGVFNYTTASVKIDSVTNGSDIYTFPTACIDFVKGSGVIKYTIKSNGHYGSDVDKIIGNSYLRFDRTRLYLNDTAIDIKVPENLTYNAETSLEVALTQSDARAAGLSDGTYRLEIEMVASEFYGDGYSTGALSNTFSGYFGNVTLDFINRGCQ